jgi:hypothetical protein
MGIRRQVVFALTLACACSDSGDAGTTDAMRSAVDAALVDAPGAQADAPGSGADAAPFDPGPEPTAPMNPRPGEVTIIQLDLPAGIAPPKLGEAAIIVGPDGTIVLLDVGNNNHDDEVYNAVVELNTQHLTVARGFPRDRQAEEVDWVVITHFHGDHAGGFEDLLVTNSDTLTVTRGVVHRGYTDLGAAMNEADFGEVCTAMRGTLAALDVPLCDSATVAPCNTAMATTPHPATECAGLFLGDLSDSTDDSAGAPTYLPLGGGARMTLVAASGHVSNGSTAVKGPTFGQTDGNQENARSIAGVISHGGFRYHFGGDMTGSGADDTEPDVESHLVATAGSSFYGALGVDVVHVHHHARRTSSNATFVDAMAPKDGRARNAIAGINAAHINSPHQETLDAWGDDNRLGGGRIWATTVTATGGSHAQLVNADGPVILQTIQAGRGYRVQAAGDTLFSLAFPSLR